MLKFQVERSLRTSQNLLSDLLSLAIYIQEGTLIKNHEISELVSKFEFEENFPFKETFEGLSVATRYPLQGSFHSLGASLVQALGQLSHADADKDGFKIAKLQNDPWKFLAKPIILKDFREKFVTYTGRVLKALSLILPLLTPST